MASAQVKEQVKNLIKSNKVMVFSKSYCPYCTRAKSALSQMGIDFKTLELDEINGGGEIQSYLRQITGQSTVPNIFVREHHLGGCDDTLAAQRKGTLQMLIDGKPEADSLFKVIKL